VKNYPETLLILVENLESWPLGWSHPPGSAEAVRWVVEEVAHLTTKIERLRIIATQFTDDLFKIPCPRDTNGDGGCGRKNCPICGEYGTLFALINKFRADMAREGSDGDHIKRVP